MMIEFASDEPG